MTTQRRKLGIRTRLFLAFGAVSGTTVIAGIAGWLLFSQVGALLDGIATRSIPNVAATLQLSTDTQALVASAPNLLSADSQERRAEQRKILQDMQNAATRQLDVVAGFDAGQASIDRLRKLIAAMNDKLTALDRAVAARIDLATQRTATADASNAAQAKLVGILSPVADKAQTDIAMVSMTLGGDQAETTATLLKLVSRQVPFVEGLSDLAADVSLVGSLLDRVDVAPDAAAVDALRKEFAGVAAHAIERVDIVEALQPTAGLREATERLLAQGSGDRSAFETRRKELDAQQDGRKLLADTRTVAGELAAEVARQADTVRQAATQATDRSHAAIAFGTFVMLVIAAASVVGALLIVWLYIGRSLVARIVGLQTVMLRLVDGDLSVEVASGNHGDEIGEMAGAVQVFKDSMIETNRLAAERAAEQAAKEQRATRLAELVHAFETKVGELTGQLSSAATEMEATANVMTTTAGHTNEQAAGVASAAEQASVNVQTVATAAEELTASIGEITRQVAQSSKVADKAVDDARQADGVVRSLAEGAQKIGDVVVLINTIAGQTNLLSLFPRIWFVINRLSRNPVIGAKSGVAAVSGSLASPADEVG